MTQNQIDDKFAEAVFKVKPSYGIETGFSNGGHFRIAQHRSELCEEAVILLSLSEAEALYCALKTLVEDGDWWSNYEEGDE